MNAWLKVLIVTTSGRTKKKKVSPGDVDKKRGSDSVKGTTGTSGLRRGGLFGSFWGRFRWWSMIWTVQVYVTMVTDGLSSLLPWLLGWSSRAIHILCIFSLQGSATVCITAGVQWEESWHKGERLPEVNESNPRAVNGQRMRMSETSTYL